MSLPFLEPTSDRSMNPKVKKVKNNKNLKTKDFGLSPLKSPNSSEMIRYGPLGYLKQH